VPNDPASYSGGSISSWQLLVTPVIHFTPNFVLIFQHLTVLLKIYRIVMYANVRFVVFTAVTTKNAIFWDVTPGGSDKNRRFGGTYSLHHQGDKNW
jgi:hypothetical protein